MKIVPRIKNWVVCVKSGDEKKTTYFKFKKKQEAIDKADTLRIQPENTIELIQTEYPIIPVIEKITENSEYRKVSDAKYAVVRKGSVDLVDTLKQAILTWFWLICPRLVFLCYRLKKKLWKNRSSVGSVEDHS